MKQELNVMCAYQLSHGVFNEGESQPQFLNLILLFNSYSQKWGISLEQKTYCNLIHKSGFTENNSSQ